MADTARSRADIKALMPDNDAYGISAQDVRDFLESTWPEERADANDFFTGPLTGYITTDLTVRGDKFTGQLASTVAASFGDTLTLNGATGEWIIATSDNLGSQFCIAIAGSAIASGASGLMLRDGLVYGSSLLSGFSYAPVYLASGGGMTQTKPGNVQILGYLEADGKLRARINWAVA